MQRLTRKMRGERVFLLAGLGKTSRELFLTGPSFLDLACVSRHFKSPTYLPTAVKKSFLCLAVTKPLLQCYYLWQNNFSSMSPPACHFLIVTPLFVLLECLACDILAIESLVRRIRPIPMRARLAKPLFFVCFSNHFFDVWYQRYHF